MFIEKEFLLFDKIVNLIYPRRCPICDGIVVPKNEKICPICKDQLNYIKEPRCKKCSKPIHQEEQEYCFDCTTKNYHFIKGYSVWVYDKNMKKSIAAFKYHNKKEYGAFYIEEILRLYSGEIREINPDAIIAIPIHKSKRNIRGYNQAEIIAEGISKELSIPLLYHTLKRNRKTLPQKVLNDKERLKNLQGAFDFSEKEIKNKHINLNKVMLIDDIYTTGSTIEVCTNILLQQGVTEVYFLCICIGKGF